MRCNNGSVAGSLFLAGGVLGVLGIIVAEALYPGYSTSQNYISDLGVGPSSLIFNSSVFLLGVLAVAGAYFVQRTFNHRVFSILAAVAGIGAIGVGLFTEDAWVPHTMFTLILFLFADLSAISSHKLQKPPLSYFSVILGVLSLSALVLFGSGTHLGLGKGGMERMIAYPALLWMVCFGAFLMSGRKQPREKLASYQSERCRPKKDLHIWKRQVIDSDLRQIAKKERALGP